MKKRNPISLERAQALIGERLAALPPAALPLEKAFHRILAEDIRAGMDQPPFPRSPYDGYAIRAEDSADATRGRPVSLRVVGESDAGDPAKAEVGPGEAVRIMTGGVIPDGADCVIPQEETDGGAETVLIFSSLSPGCNYCRRGEDFTSGALLAEKGMKVAAPVAAVAASAGYDRLTCVPEPRAAILSTGRELRFPGEELPYGRIYDANGAYLRSRLRELGLSPAGYDLCDDSGEALRRKISSALERADLLLTTGGVSTGRLDLVPEVLRSLGAEIVFHGVSIKPGMPALFALLGQKPVLSLSGNPFAAAVSFELLARPVLAALAGDRSLLPVRVSARLATGFGKESRCTRFLRGRLENGEVALPSNQGNGQLRTLIGCNCLAELPAGSGPLPAGTEIRAHLL